MNVNFDNLVEDAMALNGSLIEDGEYKTLMMTPNELKVLVLEYIERDRKHGQEPVAWMLDPHKNLSSKDLIIYDTWYSDEKPTENIEFYIPLFTHAQPTPEQIADSWISVKEILPAPYTEVLIWPKPTDFCMTAEYEKHEDYGIWKYKTYEQWGVSIDTTNPTHWMPLPKAPS